MSPDQCPSDGCSQALQFLLGLAFLTLEKPLKLGALPNGKPFNHVPRPLCSRAVMTAFFQTACQAGRVALGWRPCQRLGASGLRRSTFPQPGLSLDWKPGKDGSFSSRSRLGGPVFVVQFHSRPFRVNIQSSETRSEPKLCQMQQFWLGF